MRRLAQAQVEALGRAEAAESHVMEVLQRQEEARAQMDRERQGFADSMVSGCPSEGSSPALQEAVSTLARRLCCEDQHSSAGNPNVAGRGWGVPAGQRR